MYLENKIAEIIVQTNKTPFEQADEILKLITDNYQALQLLQPDVSGSLPNKTQLKWIDDFMPCYVTECSIELQMLKIYTKCQ